MNDSPANIPAADRADRRIPVTLLTGFLGAGKTTLLNTLLWQKAFTDAAVFINEFGDVGVDHLLVEKVDDDVVLLESGCICCSMRGDLPRALRGMFGRAQRREIPVPSRAIVETTGIADPAPIVHTLMSDPFINERFRFDGVVTVIAATHGADQIETSVEALKQIAMADRIVISKCDLADATMLEQLSARIADLNPTAPQLRSEKGAIAATDIVDVGLYDPAGKTPDVATWLAEVRVVEEAEKKRLHFGKSPRRASAHAGSDVQSFVLDWDSPFAWGRFGTLLDTLLQGRGEQILRIKGLVNVAGEAGPRVVQCVQHVRYPSVRLAEWPAEAAYADRKTRLVFIVRGLAEEDVRRDLAHIEELMVRHGSQPATG